MFVAILNGMDSKVRSNENKAWRKTIIIKESIALNHIIIIAIRSMGETE